MNPFHSFPQRILASLILACLAPLAQADLRVQTGQANLRSGPAVKHQVTGVARSGEPLTVKAYEAGYVQVILPNGNNGWIHAASQGWKDATIRAALNTRVTANPAPTTVAPPTLASVVAPVVPSNFTLTLSDLGYRQGHYFEGAYGVHSKDYFFPLPQGASSSQGSLRVYFRASPLLSQAASLRFDINGKPAHLLSLENRVQASYIDLPLDHAARQRDSVRLTIKAVLLHGENRCLDERRLALHYVHILPQTSVTLTLDSATNLAAAWTSLPAQVKVGIPPVPSATTAAALLQTAIWLRGMGRQVNFVPYTQAAHVMVDNESALRQRYPVGLPPASEQGGTLALTKNADGSPLILVSDRVLARPLSPQPLAWVRLLRGEQYRHDPVSLPANNRQTIDLIAAGLGETQYVSRAIDWNLDLAAPLVPADKQLQRMILNVVAAPHAEQSQQLLQIFLNGKLQEVRPLERDGKPHTLRFDLDRSLQRTGINQLRIAVQRTEEKGDCKGDLTAFPIQLLPGSRIDLADTTAPLNSFNDLRAYFAKGIDVYLAPDNQPNLARDLELAATVFSNLGLSVTENRVQYLKAGTVFSPKRPFVLIGRGITPDKAAVRFDRGRVHVLDGSGQPLLALDQLPGIGLAQIVSQGNVQGLSLMAPQTGTLPEAANLHLDRDNIAFISEQGVVLTVDTHEPAVSKLNYPDYGGWGDWFTQNRFWLIAAGWALIGSLLVGLYRKTRKHGTTA